VANRRIISPPLLEILGLVGILMLGFWLGWQAKGDH